MNRIVTLSLDEASSRVWDEFPRGTRSRTIRDILVDSSALLDARSQLVELELELGRLKRALTAAMLRIENEEVGMGGTPSLEHIRKVAGWDE
jgi:hypothetical protein